MEIPLARPDVTELGRKGVSITSTMDVGGTLVTFPKHFHDGSEKATDARESTISDEPVIAIRQFLNFIRRRLSASDLGINDAKSTI